MRSLKSIQMEFRIDTLAFVSWWMRAQREEGSRKVAKTQRKEVGGGSEGEARTNSLCGPATLRENSDNTEPNKLCLDQGFA
jgi:hypothetical protein